jgi:L-ascorbate metabolism protein UlaG (beta-lactamase superfamily)
LQRSDPARPLGHREIAFRWYGTASFVVRTARATLILDPYFTRDPLKKLLFGKAVARPASWPPVPMPDAILVGHGHFDHLLDAPALARDAGAPLYASQNALAVARAEGVPEPLRRPIAGGDRIPVGDLEVEVVESKHNSLWTQFLVGGDMPATPALPMWFLSYKNGPVFNFLIHWHGRTIAHIDSAQILEERLAGQQADVALVCMSDWRTSPKFFERVGGALDPDVVVPMHHDDFFAPYSKGVLEGPIAHLAEGYAAIRRDVPRASVVSLGFFDEYRLEEVARP